MPRHFGGRRTGRLQHVRDPAVPADPLGPAELAVAGLPDQVVREPQGRRMPRIVDQQTGLDRFGDQPVDRRGFRRSAAQHVHVHLGTERRRAAQQIPSGAGQLGGAPGHQAPQPVRQIHLAGRAAQPVAAGQQTRQFPDIQRVSAAEAVHHSGPRAVHRAVRLLGQEGRHGGRFEGRQGQDLDGRQAREVGEREAVTGLPHGPDDQQRHVGDVGGELPQQGERGGVGPVQVFQDEHQRTGGAERVHRGADHPEPRGGRALAVAHPCVQHLGRQPGRAAVEQPPPGPERRRPFVRVGPPGQDGAAGRRRAGDRLLDHGRLADPRLTEQEHDRASPGGRRRPQPVQGDHFRHPADEPPASHETPTMPPFCARGRRCQVTGTSTAISSPSR
jgi:hypothetical protein